MIHRRAWSLIVPLALLLWLAVLPAAWSRADDTRVGPVPFPVDASRPSRTPLLPVTLSALEERLFADASSGRFDEHTLLAAALVAGGVEDPAQVARYQRRVDALVDRLQRSGMVVGSPRQRAQVIFEFMHQEILSGGYRLDATDLTTVLDEGRFNCVSASVLFCYLAERFGLDARGVELTGHAMSRLHFGDETLEVESTCPKWFRMTGDPHRRAELVAKTTGFRHTPQSREAYCREVSGVALVATIYYNRGVDLLVQKQYGPAIEANIKALWLDPSSDTAKGNLLATMNNWAIAEGTAGRYNAAVGLLRAGLAIESGFGTFRANYVHVHRQWVEALCAQGQFDQSCALLQAAQRDLPGEPWFAQTLLGVYRRWVTTLLATEQIDRAFDVFDAAGRVPYGKAWAARMEIDEIRRYADWLAGQGREATALAVLDRSLHRHPHETLLSESRRHVLLNYERTAGTADERRPALSAFGEHFVSEASEELGSEDGMSL